jgi:hypothetical protein
LTSTLRVGQRGFPAGFGFSVYVQLSEGRGTGRCRIIVVNAESGRRCYEGSEHPLAFGADPLRVYGVKIRIQRCEFPHNGLYWVEFWYEGSVLGREPLLVR